jgi:cation diffusion facilitator family transporter
LAGGDLFHWELLILARDLCDLEGVKMDSNTRKVRIAWLSVLSNISLVSLKIIVGMLIGSVSVISEAIHSGVDLLAALIALFAVKKASQPSDEDHPFGHGKFENVSGTVEALLIFLAAAWIIYEAVHKLLHPRTLDAPFWGIMVMIFSAAMNQFISSLLFKVGKETDSIALQADAWHLRTDVYTSLGVMTGLAFIYFSGRFFPGQDFGWIDPAAAIAVALLILQAAFQLILQSARDLLDVNLPEEEAWTRQFLSQQPSPAKGFHHLRTRKGGATRFMEFHLVVEPKMSVLESHRLGDQIVAKIKERFPGCKVIVHIEPCEGTCLPHCVNGCLLSTEERLEVRSACNDPQK